MATPLTMIAKPGPTLDEMRNKDLYVGTGPWKFDHWTRLNEIVLTRNDNYWDKTRIPKLKTLVFKLYSDVSTEVLDLKAHTIDAAWPSFLASDIQDFKTDSRFNVQPEVTGRLAILEFSVKTEPLNDSRVRQAFAYAIDRSEIVSRVYKGINAKDALSLVPDVFPGYSPAFQKYSYDPDKAKQLLAAAGYPNGIDITLTFSTRDPGDSDLAVVLQSETAKAGIRLNLKQMEHSAFQALHTKGDFQGALILHWSYDYYAGVQYLMTFLANPDLGGYEAWMSGYKNTQVDNLVSTYLASTDESQTLQIGTQLQDIAAQDVPVLPLVSSLEYWISWNTVNGLTPGNPFFSTDFSVITKTA
jgi:peptide/nickel transport system substrate-binding protein